MLYSLYPPYYLIPTYSMKTCKVCTSLFTEITKVRRDGNYHIINLIFNIWDLKKSTADEKYPLYRIIYINELNATLSKFLFKCQN